MKWEEIKAPMFLLLGLSLGLIAGYLTTNREVKQACVAQEVALACQAQNDLINNLIANATCYSNPNQLYNPTAREQEIMGQPRFNLPRLVS